MFAWNAVRSTVISRDNCRLWLWIPGSFAFRECPGMTTLDVCDAVGLIRPTISLFLQRSALDPVALDADYAAALDREREAPMLERQRGLAEQLAAPAMQGGDVGLIVGRDLLEVVDGRDHLAGDRVPFGCHPQQHLQKLDDRRTVRVVARLFELRQRGVI